MLAGSDELFARLTANRIGSDADAAKAKTAPGSMLQFMTAQSAAVKEAESLRERLAGFDGALPVRRLDPATVRVSAWANRHEHSYQDAGFLALKAEISAAGGNVQPIKVRPVRPATGRAAQGVGPSNPPDGASTIGYSEVSPLPRAGVQQVCPRTQPAQVLEALVPAIFGAVSEFSTRGFSPFIARFAARDALKGNLVRFSGATMDDQGVALGVDDRGRLLVHTSSGVQAIGSGEVSVRQV